MDVQIRKLDGQNLTVNVREDATVSSLKALLQDMKLFEPAVSFHLFLRGSKLNSGSTLQSLDLREGEFFIPIPYSKKKQKPFITAQNAESNSQEKKKCHENNCELDAADSIWNMIAADLSCWKASIDEDTSQANSELVSGADTSTNILLAQHREDNGSVYFAKKDKRRSSTARKEPFVHESNTERDIDFQQTVDVTKKRKRSGTRICPPVLDRYYKIFKALNIVSGLLQKRHIQGTWKNMKAAVQQLCGSLENIDINDIQTLAALFPKLLKVASHDGTEGKLFNIDLLETSNIHEQDVQHAHVQKGTGRKEIPDSLIKRSVQRRLNAFHKAMAALVEHAHTEFKETRHNYNENTVNDFTLEEFIKIAKSLQNSSGIEHGQSNAHKQVPFQHQGLSRCKDTSDLSAPQMVEHLKQGFGSLGQIMCHELIKKREAEFSNLEVSLSDFTMTTLKRLNISKLYSHQADAINAAISGENVIIATSTASGKSICYNIPVLEDLYSNPDSCSIYLFPTKALAQDQYRVLTEMTNGLSPPINIGVYDGDTPQHQRLHLRDNARLLVTNPDMLHVSILPNHKQFERLLSNVRYVIVDEAHAYRGAFGCHTAAILRRLNRLCHHLYGRDLIFIVSSATVANPCDHAMELTGVRSITVIQQDGSPCGEKHFLLWNPPLYSTTKVPPNAQDSFRKSRRQKQKESGNKSIQLRHSSPILEISSLLSEMVQHNLRCIAFCKTRKLSELVLNYTRDILKETAPNLVESVKSYRAGYTAEDRREIERELFSGKLRAVTATNALELGVDVGSIDSTLHLGFPGTVASLWQQSGRAGRREKPSLSVYVAFESPLDQYFMKHPEKLFSRPIEHAQIDAGNPQVIDDHITCAALEHPLSVHYDTPYFGSGLQTSITRLVKKGLLGHEPTSTVQDRWFYIGLDGSPARFVSIRAIDPEKYTVIDEANNKVIEEVEESKAFYEVYEGAVYIHQGKTYLVKKLDLNAKVAMCREADVKYYTKTRDLTDVHVLGGQLAYPRKVTDGRWPSTTAKASLCRVTSHWIGFRRIWQRTNQTFDSVDLFLPDYSYETQAAWIGVPHEVRKYLDEKGLPFRAGLHAASHALLNIIPLYILCSSSDLGTECANPHDTRYFPERLLVFDRHPGGIGIAAQAQPLFAELTQAALELLMACECEVDVGCPSCVQSLTCSEYNEVLNKPAAIAILKAVIEAENSYRESNQTTQGTNGN